MQTTTRLRFVIVGAGLAGASTAYHLARSVRGDHEILVLEQEAAAGQHSSSRNAEMIRQVVRPSPVATLACRGARFCAEMGAERGRFRFRVNGSLLLGDYRSLKAIQGDVPSVQNGGPPSLRLLDREAAALEVEALHDMNLEAALWTPSDGVVDATGMLSFFLGDARRYGAQLITGARVLGLRREAGKVTGVRLQDRTLDADMVVNATGPWAGVFGNRCEAHPVPFRPMRRHLFHSGPLECVDPGWPFVWDINHDWYFRPESEGLLLCAGDEEEVRPGVPDIAPGVVGLLHDKLTRHLPGLADIPIAHQWCGLRTFSPDRSFVIGPDPDLRGFFWVAGLGGHGVTTCAPVGDIAARALLGDPEELLTAFSPARFG